MIHRRGTARRLGVRLGLFAVLFQAILFGWHHHDPVWPGRLPVPIAVNPTTSPQAIDDEDGCEICQVLHHLTAAPADLSAALPAPTPAPLLLGRDEAFFVRPSTFGFRARAPPLA